MRLFLIACASNWPLTSRAVEEKMHLRRAQTKIVPEHTVEFLTQMLEQFKYFAKHYGDRMETRQEAMRAKLKAAEAVTTDENTRQALETSIGNSEASEKSAIGMFADMKTFFTSIEVVLGSKKTGGSGRGCADIKCGKNASCTSTTAGAECVCDEGYQGNGVQCESPAAFVPRQLLYDGAFGRSPLVQDLTAYVFGHRVVVAWRDISHSNSGYVKLGDMINNQVSFAPAEKFADKGFSPSVVGWANDRLVLAYRDDDKDGTGIIIGAAIGISGIRGADKHLTIGKPVNFSSNQSHRTAVLALSNNRFIVNYSAKERGKPGLSATSFGSSTLGRVGATGEISLSGTFRFSEEAVTRIEAIVLNEKSFVVAFRGSKLIDEMDPNKFVYQEASCVLGTVDGEDLVFDPHPLHLEPLKQQFWARGLSLVAPNIFTYAYHSGLEEKTKLVTVKVDEVKHRMKRVSTEELMDGDTPYVKQISMPYTGSPHSITFYQPKGKMMVANICSVDAQTAELTRCEETDIGGAVDSFAAATLPSGRLLLLFSPGGVPYYQVVALAKK